MKRILIVAGEASADIYGAQLIERVRRLDPSCTFVGVGGPRMKAVGMDIRISAADFSVFGFSEWLMRAPEVLMSYRKLVQLSKHEKLDGAILIDLPDTNLRLARHLKARFIPVCYYVSPQLWAWRSWRIRSIKKNVDKMLVLFPFEREFYEKHAVDVAFVGHPLVDLIEKRAPAPVNIMAPRIALLPGSRRSEIKNHVPLLVRAMEGLRTRYPGAEFVVPVAGTLNIEFVKGEFVKQGESNLYFEDDSQKVLRECSVALVASGTATLEATLIGVPFTIFYKVGRSSKLIYDLLIKVPFIGMPNLLAQREIVKEYFQDEATPETLIHEVVQIIENSDYREKIVDSLSDCRNLLRNGNPEAGAAQEFCRFINEYPRTTFTETV